MVSVELWLPLKLQIVSVFYSNTDILILVPIG